MGVRSRFAVSCLGAVLLWAGVMAPVAAAPARVDVITILADRTGPPAVAARAVAADHGVGLTFVYEHALAGFAGSVPEGRLNALRNDPRVVSVELDQVVHATAQSTPTGIQRIFADDNANIGIDGNDDQRVDVDVAVIDTGIDLDHPDLNVVQSTNCTGGSPWFASCGSGGDDDNDHGTHVAGTIGALDNDLGVVGVAPGARLHAVKVLTSTGSGYMSWIIAGIDWVTARADTIEVANMSLSCECSSAGLDTALTNSTNAGIVHVVAAGNADSNAATFSPAAHPDVVTVSALADFDGEPGGAGSPTCRSDGDDTLANFSNFGSTIEIAAPGVCIRSTVPGGGYATFSGTSMASPHAAGAAALLASGSGDPTGRSDVLAIRQTLIDTGNLDWTDDSGDGIQEPLLDVSDASEFDPAMTSGGGEPLPTVHVGDLDGEGVDTNGTWTAEVWVTIHDETDQPLDGASVYGTISGGGFTPVTDVCTTPESGTGDPEAGPGKCRLEFLGIQDGDTPVTITIDNVTQAGYAYSSSDNHDPDADSDGTVIIVAEPGGGGGPPMHVSDLDGEGADTGAGWDANVWVEVVDAFGAPIDGATVTGDFVTWAGGTGTDSCVTPEPVDGDSGAGPGRCRLELTGIPDADQSATLTVTDVAHASFTYDGAANEDPDGDSDGTTITVLAPASEPPPPTADPMHVGDLDSQGVDGSLGYGWDAIVWVEVQDDTHAPLDGATVTANIVTGFSGAATDTCTTPESVPGDPGEGAGRCRLEFLGIANGDSPVSVTVTGVTHADHSYESADNHDPDGDSNGTTIAVTEPAPPPSDPADLHVADLDDAGSVNHGSTWEARLNILVEAGGVPVEGSTVTLDWVGSRGSSGTVTCTTDATGWCTAEGVFLPKREGDVTFTVTNIVASGLTYDPAANHDPDTDSNGTSILVTKGS